MLCPQPTICAIQMQHNPFNVRMVSSAFRSRLNEKMSIGLRNAHRISFTTIFVKIFSFAFKCRSRSLDAIRTPDTHTHRSGITFFVEWMLQCKRGNNLWVKAYLLLVIVMQLSDKGVMCTRSDGTQSRKKLCRFLFSPSQLAADATLKTEMGASESKLCSFVVYASHALSKMKTVAAAATACLTLIVDIDSDERQMNGKKRNSQSQSQTQTNMCVSIMLNREESFYRRLWLSIVSISNGVCVCVVRAFERPKFNQ